jgi:hypothetical protein
VKRDGSVMYSQLAMRPASTCRPRVDPVDGSFDGFVQEIVYYGDASGHGGKRWDGRPVVFTPRESVVFFNGLEKDPVSGMCPTSRSPCGATGPSARSWRSG